MQFPMHGMLVDRLLRMPSWGAREQRPDQDDMLPECNARVSYNVFVLQAWLHMLIPTLVGVG